MRQRQLKCELWMRAAELGFSKSHNYLLGMHYFHGENWKKAKFHLEAPAMTGHERRGKKQYWTP